MEFRSVAGHPVGSRSSPFSLENCAGETFRHREETSQTSRCAASDQRKARAISSPAPYFHRAASRLQFRPTTLQRSRGVALGQRSIPAAPQIHRTPLARLVSRDRLLFGVFQLVPDGPQILFPARGTALLSLLTVTLSSALPCE